MFRLKEVLKEKNMTAKDLALKAGVTPVVLSRYINGTSSPRLDLMERLAEILEVDIVELIKDPEAGGRGRPRRKTIEERQHDTYVKLLTFCKYYHGEISIPNKIRNDEAAIELRKIERDVCYYDYLYTFDTGGNSLRHKFYLSVASEINYRREHYVEYMQLYFGDRPKVLDEMYGIFGYPEEVSKKK